MPSDSASDCAATHRKSVKTSVFTLLDRSSSRRQAAAAEAALEELEAADIDDKLLPFLKAAVVVLLHMRDHDPAAICLASNIVMRTLEEEVWADLSTIIEQEISNGSLTLVLGLIAELPRINRFYEVYVHPSIQENAGSFQNGMNERLKKDEDFAGFSLLSRLFSMKEGVKNLDYTALLKAAVDSPEILSPCATDVEKAAVAYNVAVCLDSRKAKFSVEVTNKLLKFVDELIKV